jgi:hypothetical protein
MQLNVPLMGIAEISERLNYTLSRLFFLVGVGLPLLGIPATLVLSPDAGAVLWLRFLTSGFFYLITAAILRPETWEQLPVTNTPGRLRTVAFLTFAAGTAVWAS